MSKKPYWKNICRHYTSGFDVIRDNSCLKGICYRDVTSKPDEPGSLYRLPCHTPNDGHGLKVLEDTGPAGTCEHFSALTEEELAQQEEESKKAFERSVEMMTKVAPIISAVKKQYKGKSIRGVKTCPICKGKLHISHAASNGHVHVRCETEKCIAFME